MKSKTINFNYADFEPIENIALTFKEAEKRILLAKKLQLKIVECHDK